MQHLTLPCLICQRSLNVTWNLRPDMNCGSLFNKSICAISSCIVKSFGKHIQRRWHRVADFNMASIGSPTISVTFLSNGGVLSPPKSLIIVTAHNCYLINAPEAMSRVLQESGVKFSKISHIFVTGNQWELCGGLIGTCLNVSAAGLQSAVKLHGPPIVKEVGNLMAKFSDNTGMKIEYNGAPQFNDSVFQVSSLNVRCENENAQSYCYLFKPIPMPAKLDMIKAVKMNFPVSMLKDGVTAKRLKAGESVELPDGRIIDGKELLFPTTPAKSILVLDCCTQAVARKLAASQQLKQWIADGDIDLVVHLADANLLRTDAYRSVVDLFKGAATDSTVTHAVMDARSSTPALYGAHQCQLMLNSLHDGIFPLLYGHRFMEKEMKDDQLASAAYSTQAAVESTKSASLDRPAASSDVMFPECATSCETYQEYYLRPPQGFQPLADSRREPFTESAMRDKVFEDSETHISRLEFSQRMAEFVAERASWTSTSCAAGPTHDVPVSSSRSYPWLQFLGTVSSNPIKYRNVSAILLHISEDTKILLDCGEGTLFQLMNFYGEAKCHEVLRSIKAICISHMHLDHQSGIFCLLKARRQAFADAGLTPKPCAYVGPRGFSRWLEFFASNETDGLSDVQSVQDLELYWLEILSGMASHWGNAASTVARFDSFVANVLGLEKLAVVPVEHSTKVAFGFVIRGVAHGNGTTPWKIVYSGDTVPCRSLVDAGRDCDLLIHEATFQDGLESEARAKKHSTVGQALSQAAAMSAKHSVLTHFSARYTSAVPILKPPELNSGIGFAYDHMCVGLPDLANLARFTPMLWCLFPKHFGELEKRSMRLRLAGSAAAALPEGPSSSSAFGGVRRSPPPGKGKNKKRRVQGD